MSVFADQTLQWILPYLESHEIIYTSRAVPATRKLLIQLSGRDAAPEDACPGRLLNAVRDEVYTATVLANRGDSTGWVETLNQKVTGYRIFAGAMPRAEVLKTIIDHKNIALPALSEYLKIAPNTEFKHSTSVRDSTCYVLAFDPLYYAIEERRKTDDLLKNTKGQPDDGYVKTMIDYGARISSKSWGLMRRRNRALMPRYVEMLKEVPDTRGDFIVYLLTNREHIGMLPEIIEKIKHKVKDPAELLYNIESSFGWKSLPHIPLYELVCSKIPYNGGGDEHIEKLTKQAYKFFGGYKVLKVFLKHGYWTPMSVQWMYFTCFEGDGDIELLEAAYATGVEFRGIKATKKEINDLYPDARDYRINDPILIVVKNVYDTKQERMRPILEFVLTHYPKRRYANYIYSLCESLERVNMTGRRDGLMQDACVVWALEVLLKHGIKPVHSSKSLPGYFCASSLFSKQQGFKVLMDHGGDMNINGGAFELIRHTRPVDELIELFARYEDKIQWDQVEESSRGTIFAFVISSYPVNEIFRFLERFPQAALTSFTMNVGHDVSPTVLHFLNKFDDKRARQAIPDEALKWLDIFLSPENHMHVDVNRVVDGHSVVSELVAHGLLDRYPHLDVDWLQKDSQQRTLAYRVMWNSTSNPDVVCRVLRKQMDAGWDINSTTQCPFGYTIGHALVISAMRHQRGFMTAVLERMPEIDMNIVSPKTHDTPLMKAINSCRYSSDKEWAHIVIDELVASGRVNVFARHTQSGVTMVDYARAHPDGVRIESLEKAFAQANATAKRQSEESVLDSSKRQRV